MPLDWLLSRPTFSRGVRPAKCKGRVGGSHTRSRYPHRQAVPNCRPCKPNSSDLSAAGYISVLRTTPPVSLLHKRQGQSPIQCCGFARLGAAPPSPLIFCVCLGSVAGAASPDPGHWTSQLLPLLVLTPTSRPRAPPRGPSFPRVDLALCTLVSGLQTVAYYAKFGFSNLLGSSFRSSRLPYLPFLPPFTHAYSFPTSISIALFATCSSRLETTSSPSHIQSKPGLLSQSPSPHRHLGAFVSPNRDKPDVSWSISRARSSSVCYWTSHGRGRICF